ncbi:hypothetical protein [Albimonas pacifica]|uniref:Uncharacterized protein n=1 Tax=Albimonas pacifica TaxID=1114924 RepID=A0A1I3LI09_9RHOB|nr:hypothetical protein [Albimonas pacifica]SFI84388.1 hypothetical protein SAMN05216258_11039 [Albimonas pacifica]
MTTLMLPPIPYQWRGDRDILAFVNGLVLAVGGPGTIVTPGDGDNALAPTSVPFYVAASLAPVSVAAAAVEIQPVAPPSRDGAPLDPVASCGCDNGGLEPV